MIRNTGPHQKGTSVNW